MTAVPAALPQPEAVLPGWFTSLQLQTAGMPVLSSKQLENVPVVVPPPGVVGLRSLAYRRTVVPGQGTMLVAVLPASREDDLRAGASAEELSRNHSFLALQLWRWTLAALLLPARRHQDEAGQARQESAACRPKQGWVGTNGVGRCNGKDAAQLQRR